MKNVLMIRHVHRTLTRQEIVDEGNPIASRLFGCVFFYQWRLDLEATSVVTSHHVSGVET